VEAKATIIDVIPCLPEPIQFTINLSVGINLVSIPVELEGWRMSDLAEYIGRGDVSMIIWYDDTRRKFVSYMPHFPDDSPANAPVECGAGYIIVMKVEKELIFEGNPCKDEIAAPSLMPLMLSSDGQSTSIFVVTGSIRQQDTGDTLNDVSVMIRNLRTGQIVCDVAGTLAGYGNYVATFVASSEEVMTYIGDELEITAIDKGNQFTITPVTYTLTTQDISAYVLVMPLHLSLPKKSTLLPNYPNPFNPETWIPFKLAHDTPVTISIYDTKGQLIHSISLGTKQAGIHTTKDKAVYWDGRDSLGQKVSSGLYYYTLQAGDFTATRKMMILK
jgi:hypothetical protein